MLAAKLDNEHQGLLWCEAVNTAQWLKNHTPNSVKLATPNEMWDGSRLSTHKHLVQWGRIGFVTIRGHVRKLEPKSIKCVCVGYADNHPSDCYRMYNPVTKRVFLSRDITWADWHGSTVAIPESLKMFHPEVTLPVTDDPIGEEVVEAREEAVYSGITSVPLPRNQIQDHI